MQFLAHAREDVPALLGAVDELVSSLQAALRLLTVIGEPAGDCTADHFNPDCIDCVVARANSAIDATGAEVPA